MQELLVNKCLNPFFTHVPKSPMSKVNGGIVNCIHFSLFQLDLYQIEGTLFLSFGNNEIFFAEFSFASTLRVMVALIIKFSCRDKIKTNVRDMSNISQYQLAPGIRVQVYVSHSNNFA